MEWPEEYEGKSRSVTSDAVLGRLVWFPPKKEAHPDFLPPLSPA